MRQRSWAKELRGPFPPGDRGDTGRRGNGGASLGPRVRGRRQSPVWHTGTEAFPYLLTQERETPRGEQGTEGQVDVSDKVQKVFLLQKAQRTQE